MRSPAMAFSRRLTWAVLAFVFVLTCSQAVQAQAVRYVDASAPQGGDGSSWVNAFSHLHDALQATGGGHTEIRIAQGAYTPTQGSGLNPLDREAVFHVPAGTSLLGGFAGRTSSDPDQRDCAAYPTVISADLAGDDGPGEINRADNSYTLFDLQQVDNVLIDGVTLTGATRGGIVAWSSGLLVSNCVLRQNQGALLAHASVVVLDAVSVEENSGHEQGAVVSAYSGTLSVLNSSWTRNNPPGVLLHCWFGNVSISGTVFRENNCTVAADSAVADITDCVFDKNRDSLLAALSIHGGELNMNRCRFEANQSTRYSGALQVSEQAQATIANCLFRANNSGYGSISVTNSSADFTNCDFDANVPATQYFIRGSYGAFHGGESNLNFSGCSFTGNQSASQGSAIRIMGCTTALTNCVFTGNHAQGGGAAIYGSGGTAQLLHCLSADNGSSHPYVTNSISWGYYGSLTAYNSIFWDGPYSLPLKQALVTAAYCCIQDQAPEDGTVFPGEGNIDSYPEFLIPSGYHLSPNSPCIDTGGTAPPFDAPEFDFDGQARVVDGNGDGSALPDMGPHEYNPWVPCLCVTEHLSEQVEYGTTSWQHALQIRNCGGGNLNWTIAAAPEWLTVSPTQGSMPADGVSEVQLLADLSDARPGRRTCELQVHSPDINNTPRFISVTLDVVTPYHVPWVYPTIQQAVDAAPDGETIYLAEGTYQGPGNSDVVIQGKSLTLTSETGPDRTILDQSPTGGLRLVGEAAGDSRVQGITITGFKSNPGLLCEDCSPTIANCVFEQEPTLPPADHATAIVLQRSSATLQDCLITGLQKTALRCYEGSPRFERLQLIDNYAPDDLVFFGGIGRVELTDCIIHRNSAEWIFTAWMGINSVNISNSVVEDNHATFIYGPQSEITISDSVFKQNGAILWAASAKIVNCQLEDNAFVYGDHVRNGIAANNLTVENSVFAGNSANSGRSLIVAYTELSVQESLFIDNARGIGILSRGNSLIAATTFEGNYSIGLGVIVAQSGALEIRDCQFRGNSANSIHAQTDSLTIRESVFSNNRSSGPAGVIWAKSPDILLLNSVFDGNTTSFGPGVARLTGPAPLVVNCTFLGNHAPPDGAGQLGAGLHIAGEGLVANSVFWDNSPRQGLIMKNRADYGGMLSHCIVHNGEAGFPRPPGEFAQFNNSSQDPLFLRNGHWAPDPSGLSQDQFWNAGDYHLTAGSPGIDAGDNTAVPEDVTSDLDGNPRFVDDPFKADTGVPGQQAAVVDIGAYEFQPAGVVGRHVFYNNSVFDGWTPHADPADDLAIATDKQALLPGQTPGINHYISYSKGINGIILDIRNAATEPCASDFEFTLTGRDGSEFEPAPPPSCVSIRWAGGAEGSDRITLIWPDNAIPNSNWLQIRIKSDLAGGRLGLSRDDVFHFGLAIGETQTLSGRMALVNPRDVAMIRQHARRNQSPPSIESPCDINRDGAIDAADEAVSASSQTGPHDCLVLPDLCKVVAGKGKAGPLRQMEGVDGQPLTGSSPKAKP